MALSQSLQQKLLQKLSPQQIQLMKLLQVPTANLEERIKEELEENPALEESQDDNTPENADDIQEDFESTEEEFESESAEDYDSVDISDYVNEFDDDVADYKLRDENYPEAEEQKTLPYKIETSFHEQLLGQLGMMVLNERDMRIAEQIVGSIDDDGYLRREISSIVDDLAFRQNIDASENEVTEMIKKIQQFDPPGVAARDLQECLLLQLQRRKSSSKGSGLDMAIDVLTNYFDEFTKKHYDKIQRGLNITDEQFKEVINQIIKSNPKPGGNIGEVNKAESYVVPDFFIFNN